MGIFIRPRRALIRLATPSVPAHDPLDELERLAKLRESGALTEAEFSAMKAKLIGG